MTVPPKDAKKADRRLSLGDVIPYKDENPTELAPVATIGVIALNVLAWVFIQGLGAEEPLARSVCQLGLIPAEVLRAAPAGRPQPLGPGPRFTLPSVALWRSV